MEVKKEETIGQQFGRLGGRATLKKYGKEHFRKMVQLRWEKAKKEKAENADKIAT